MHLDIQDSIIDINHSMFFYCHLFIVIVYTVNTWRVMLVLLAYHHRTWGPGWLGIHVDNCTHTCPSDWYMFAHIHHYLSGIHWNLKYTCDIKWPIYGFFQHTSQRFLFVLYQRNCHGICNVGQWINTNPWINYSII